ncbi:MAG: prephenate dehydrogenase [bacterium]|nr:MAG: prephenate dehydrogenase [bacterium]
MTNKNLFFESAVIIGVGLIGGSIARALKTCSLAGRIVGCGRSRENLDTALELGIIDQKAPPEEAVKNADIIFLCTPVLSILPMLRKIAPRIKPGALVTDAGSTKKEIVEGAQKIAGGDFVFIGSHPIAGTEKSGAASSSENLFDGRKCIITPAPDTPSDALRKLKAFWERAGMETSVMDPEIHDRVFGAVSHLPHMVVAALVNAVLNEDRGDELLEYAAGGFKDFTRIASSPPDMWSDIALSNAGPLEDLIGKVKNQLDSIEAAIRAKDKNRLLEIFGKSRKFRQKLL